MSEWPHARATRGFIYTHVDKHVGGLKRHIDDKSEELEKKIAKQEERVTMLQAELSFMCMVPLESVNHDDDTRLSSMAGVPFIRGDRSSDDSSSTSVVTSVIASEITSVYTNSDSFMLRNRTFFFRVPFSGRMKVLDCAPVQYAKMHIHADDDAAKNEWKRMLKSVTENPECPSSCKDVRKGVIFNVKQGEFLSFHVTRSKVGPREKAKDFKFHVLLEYMITKDVYIAEQDTTPEK